MEFQMDAELKNSAGNSRQNPDSESQGEECNVQRAEDERIRDTGEIVLKGNQNGTSQTGAGNIHLLTIIGEIEGHDNLSSASKTTKYEHILPRLAAIEDSDDIQGVLVLLNTMGGDVEAGLSIAEMLATLSKPTVSLVLGGSHSIGVPIAVSTDYSFIVPTGTMVIHPVRTNGTVLGVAQTFEYFRQIQDRITGFISSHSRVSREELEKMMLETGILTKDMGTILVGAQAVERGIIDEVGGISRAVKKLRELIAENQQDL